MEYYSATKKNEIMPFAAARMDLEIVILSEVRQGKTNIMHYHLYVETRKKGTDEFTYLTEIRVTDMQKRSLWLPAGKGGGVIIGTLGD